MAGFADEDLSPLRAGSTNGPFLRVGESLIVVGPTPPPIHGVAFATPHVLRAVGRTGRLADHLQTSDPRPVSTTDRLDLRNVWLAVVHALGLARLLVRHRHAAVYLPISQGIWGFLRDAVFIWTARLCRRRVIIHLHGGSFAVFAATSPRWARLFIRATLKRVDQAWVLTEAHRDIFDGYIPRGRIRVLANVSEDIGSQFEDRPVSDQHRIKRLLYLSNLLPEKGCFDLLDALSLLGEDAKGVELRMVGEADLSVAAEVRRRAARLASHGVDVRYDGVLTGLEKVAAFAWADAFVLPTRYPLEGQPLCLLEAMSAGLPIVSTFHSGIPCTVRDGREALLVAPGDRDALARAIERLLGDGELSARIAAAARRRYHDRYRPESFEAAVSALLVGTVGAPAAGS